MRRGVFFAEGYFSPVFREIWRETINIKIVFAMNMFDYKNEKLKKIKMQLWLRVIYSDWLIKQNVKDLDVN